MCQMSTQTTQQLHLRIQGFGLWKISTYFFVPVCRSINISHIIVRAANALLCRVLSGERHWTFKSDNGGTYKATYSWVKRLENGGKCVIFVIRLENLSIESHNLRWKAVAIIIYQFKERLWKIWHFSDTNWMFWLHRFTLGRESCAQASNLASVGITRARNEAWKHIAVLVLPFVLNCSVFVIRIEFQQTAQPQKRISFQSVFV